MWAQFARQGGDMTARAVFTKVCQEGRQILRNVLVKYQKVSPTQVSAKPSAIKRGHDLQIKQPTARPSFSSVLRQFIPRGNTQSLASQFSRSFARRSPFMAFVGLSLASGFQNQEEEVVDTIHNTVKGLSSIHGETSLLEAIQRTGLSFDQLEFGKLIGKGCNAAVYEAKLKDPAETVEETTNNISLDDVEDVAVIEGADSDIEEDADQSAPTEWTPRDLIGQQLERFLLIGDEGKQEEELSDSDSVVSFEVLDEGPDLIWEEIAALDSEMNEGVSSEKNETFPPQHNLAVKKMFNYDIKSNAASILRAMEKETVPAKLANTHSQMEQWQNGNKFRKKRNKELPPHPNIVDMWGVFVGPVTCLAESLEQYPAALPPRINQHGMGRNSTLYLVMKKYDMTLREYLTQYNPGLETRMFLLLQLLEGVAHLGQHEVAHRDMKSDNILLSNIKDVSGSTPELVISDFGCCLADPDHGFKLPYPTEEVDKGGNTALMPPEILCKEAGRFAVLDYSRADIWSVGALAYEIFGLGNPFYGDQGGKLHSRTYSQKELPALPDNIPLAVRKLVRHMLSRNPKERPSPAMAANIMHMLLWMPSDWLLPSNRVTMSDIKWWLVTMTAEVTLQHCFQGNGSQELALKTTFLQKLNMNIIGEAWSFLKQTL